ncbi:hypothetical protein AKJ52_01295 [candidate division MSBL1 archaeon SCGC-AAA382C18]|uniref:DOD-type homing endonuclease domain-containing protein n=1 Tax=candidate division MSBL1 archaeon SCGC-AAA382C18 TaxID=1698281 RepID=A0A133VKH7_9EURY|nr:hypothetical protein AKJ52_01295 [candidate division MSBL1 archaeon SCGC-AAA382C18]
MRSSERNDSSFFRVLILRIKRSMDIMGGPSLTDEKIEKMKSLDEKGWSYRRIARELDISHSTVGRYLGKVKLGKTAWDGKVGFSKADSRRKLEIPDKVTGDVAEIAGALAGDGHLHHYLGRDYRVSIEGDPEKDREWYDEHLTKLLKEVHNLEVEMRIRSTEDYKVYGFQVGSKAIFQFYTNVLGLPSGEKKEKLKVPNSILKDEELFCRFVRGLFDTDGSLYIEDKGGRNYPRIQIQLASRKIIEQLDTNLDELGFVTQTNFDVESHGGPQQRDKPSTMHQLRLNGRGNLSHWLELIGFKNPTRHRSKLSEEILESKLGSEFKYEDIKPKMEELREEGKSYKEIAEELDIPSPHTIWRYLNRGEGGVKVSEIAGGGQEVRREIIDLMPRRRNVESGEILERLQERLGVKIRKQSFYQQLSRLRKEEKIEKIRRGLYGLLNQQI